jgi:hypothetical protein
MSITKIPLALREHTRQRAGRRCEYCLLAEEQAFLPFEADHIGRVTVRILRINLSQRVEVRAILADLGLYP